MNSNNLKYDALLFYPNDIIYQCLYNADYDYDINHSSLNASSLSSSMEYYLVGLNVTQFNCIICCVISKDLVTYEKLNSILMKLSTDGVKQQEKNGAELNKPDAVPSSRDSNVYSNPSTEPIIDPGSNIFNSINSNTSSFRCSPNETSCEKQQYVILGEYIPYGRYMSLSSQMQHEYDADDDRQTQQEYTVKKRRFRKEKKERVANHLQSMGAPSGIKYAKEREPKTAAHVGSVSRLRSVNRVSCNENLPESQKTHSDRPYQSGGLSEEESNLYGDEHYRSTNSIWIVMTIQYMQATSTYLPLIKKVHSCGNTYQTSYLMTAYDRFAHPMHNALVVVDPPVSDANRSEGKINDTACKSSGNVEDTGDRMEDSTSSMNTGHSTTTVPSSTSTFLQQCSSLTLFTYELETHIHYMLLDAMLVSPSKGEKSQSKTSWKQWCLTWVTFGFSQFFVLVNYCLTWLYAIVDVSMCMNGISSTSGGVSSSGVGLGNGISRAVQCICAYFICLVCGLVEHSFVARHWLETFTLQYYCFQLHYQLYVYPKAKCGSIAMDGTGHGSSSAYVPPSRRSHGVRPIPLREWSPSKSTQAQYQSLYILTNTMVLKCITDWLIGLVYCYAIYTHAEYVYQCCYDIGASIQFVVLVVLEWINHAPIGIKFNIVATRSMSDIIILLIHTSGQKLMSAIDKDVGVWLVKTVALLGVLGISTPLVVIMDIVRLLTFHIKLAYGGIAVVTHYQYQLLCTLFYLFQNKKKNVLRCGRIDTCVYDSEQLMYGTFLFVMLCFLFPSCLALYCIFLCFQFLISTVWFCVWSGYMLVTEAPYYLLYCYLRSLFNWYWYGSRYISAMKDTSLTIPVNGQSHGNRLMDGELSFINYQVTSDQPINHTYSHQDKSVKYSQTKCTYKPHQYVYTSLCYNTLTLKAILLKYFWHGSRLAATEGLVYDEGKGDRVVRQFNMWVLLMDICKYYVIPCIWGQNTTHTSRISEVKTSAQCCPMSPQNASSFLTGSILAPIPSLDYVLLNLGGLLDTYLKNSSGASIEKKLGSKVGARMATMSINYQYRLNFLANYRCQLLCAESTHGSVHSNCDVDIGMDVKSIMLMKSNRVVYATDRSRADNARYSAYMTTVFAHFVRHMLQLECFHISALMIMSVSLTMLILAPLFFVTLICISINK